ncbi:hypothetical protein P9213_13935, partial [Geobacillus stearothermophilus]|uniref:hypothetical protein n=1 Tax=Geobacillus stearothermophilus TaxID=1422 RepID=UPI002E236486|nr:hypothetical protein [Geobacillus stearothermophilus]
AEPANIQAYRQLADTQPEAHTPRAARIPAKRKRLPLAAPAGWQPHVHPAQEAVGTPPIHCCFH